MKSLRLLNLLLLGFATAIAIAMLPAICLSICIDGRHPSAKEEFASSDFVIVGTVQERRDISSPEDPSGIEATLYYVEVQKTFRGQTQAKIIIRSDNTSSRFVMLPDRRYILFIVGTPDGGMVDACGNSGLVEDRVDAIIELLSMCMRP